MKTPRASNITIGISSGVPWPKVETRVLFKGRHFLLRPETESVYPSLILELDNKTDSNQGLSLCREFLSVLSWVEDSYIREEQSSAGLRAIYIGKGPSWKSIHVDKFYIRHLPETADPKAQLALALYREAQGVNSVPYKFLGFFKVLNIKYKTRVEHAGWINANLNQITDRNAAEAARKLRFVQADIGTYLYESGRCAVAHAFKEDQLVNPDDATHLERLYTEMPLIKALAELLIEQELGVKSKTTYYLEHLYELEGFRKKLPPSLIERLSLGESVPLSGHETLENINLEIRDKPARPSLQNLAVTYRETADGILIVDCAGADGVVKVVLRLNFKTNRLEFVFERDIQVQDDGSFHSLTCLKDCWLFVRDLLGNGELQVALTGGGGLLGRKDPHIPENIDFGAAYKEIDAAVAEIDHKIEDQRKSLDEMKE